jgi:hypothetical protein
VVDPCSDGPGSSDDYVPPPEDSREKPDREDDTFDPSEDDIPAVASKPRKKKEPKGTLRKTVEEEHLRLATEANSKGKRKDPPLTIAHVFFVSASAPILTPYKVRSERPRNLSSRWWVVFAMAGSVVEQQPLAPRRRDPSPPAL